MFNAQPRPFYKSERNNVVGDLSLGTFFITSITQHEAPLLYTDYIFSMLKSSAITLGIIS
jgi:hypothetical protein